MNAKESPALYRVSFPSCLSAGKSIYYTVYNSDGSEYLSRRNIGVVEFGSGCFGVELQFDTKNNWFILWDINGTSYKAGEEIIIHDFDFEPQAIKDLKDMVQFLINLEGGRWLIDENTHEMIFYKEDNTTEIARFSLHDITGQPAHINVYERRKIPTP